MCSTGNSFTEIKLDRSPNTLIVGENGSGKSTLLDAITYVLFNKPFRNVSKPQLINSINRKKLMVEVEFDIGKNKYLVRRGAIPAVFEIIQNGQKINENANVRDFQKVLEEGILKLNYKSFTQICLLGDLGAMWLGATRPYTFYPRGVPRSLIRVTYQPFLLYVEGKTSVEGVRACGVLP